MSRIPYRKILIPIDGSAHSVKAVSHGRLLAECFNAEVGLLFVLGIFQELQPFTQMSVNYISEKFYDEAQEYGQKVLDDTAALLPSVAVTTFLEIGSPAEVITEFSKANGYDLIVIGSRGLGLIKGVVMGSVSSHVVHNAPCPVMVVK